MTLFQSKNTEFEYSNASKSFRVQWETVRRNNKQNSGRLPQRNILQNKPGPRNEARNVIDPLTAFNLFLPDDLLETVVAHTNNRISFFHDKLPNLRDARTKLVDLVEKKAFLGIMYSRAALKQNLRDSQSIWYHKSSNLVFVATMSLNRLSFLTRFTQFDDRSTREERNMYDKFDCFRDVFEKVNENNAKWRYPCPYLAIDETLYPCRGQIGFKQ